MSRQPVSWLLHLSLANDLPEINLDPDGVGVAIAYLAYCACYDRGAIEREARTFSFNDFQEMASDQGFFYIYNSIIYLACEARRTDRAFPVHSFLPRFLIHWISLTTRYD